MLIGELAQLQERPADRREGHRFEPGILQCSYLGVEMLSPKYALKLISISIGIIVIGCSSSPPLIVENEAISDPFPLSENESVIFGYLYPWIHYNNYIQGFSPGLTGLAGIVNTDVRISFINKHTNSTYSTKVPAYGNKIYEFFVVLPIGEYSISISHPSIENVITTELFRLDERADFYAPIDASINIREEQSAYYCGKMDIHTDNKEFTNGYLKIDKSQFEEFKTSFINRCTHFSGKVQK
ncbi:MAG: hypothetical protein ABIE92_00125 [bacterium]